MALGLVVCRFNFLLTFGVQFSSKIRMGFWIWYLKWFSVFPIWIPVPLQSEQ